MPPELLCVIPKGIHLHSEEAMLRANCMVRDWKLHNRELAVAFCICEVLCPNVGKRAIHSNAMECKPSSQMLQTTKEEAFVNVAIALCRRLTGVHGNGGWRSIANGLCLSQMLLPCLKERACFWFFRWSERQGAEEKQAPTWFSKLQRHH